MKGAILPVQGGGGGFFQGHLSSAATQPVSKGRGGQREKIGFPEEPDSLILLIPMGPERLQPLSGDKWHLQR